MTNERSERPTVLVIDEDDKVLDAIRGALEAAGYRVLTRNRSAGSIAVIVKEKPDVVLAELNMTRITGETIAKILSRTQPRPNAIVLLHSALPVEILRLKALAAGAQGYVQKTERLAELVQRIEHYLAAAKSTSRSRLLASTALENNEPALHLSRAGGTVGVPPHSGLAPVGAGAKPPQGDDEMKPARRAGFLVRTLFVDDDWSLLRSYRTALSTELQAEFLTSGEDAIQRILSDSPPDIVVCDIVMPFVTGADLYRRAVHADPSWSERFLFLTGASSTRVVVDFLNEHEGRVLFKPVPSNRLLDTIRKMDSSAAPRASAPLNLRGGAF